MPDFDPYDYRLIGGTWSRTDSGPTGDVTVTIIFDNGGKFSGTLANPVGNNTWYTENNIIYFTNFQIEGNTYRTYEIVDEKNMKLNDVLYTRP